jgi:hypothetical protein
LSWYAITFPPPAPAATGKSRRGEPEPQPTPHIRKVYRNTDTERAILRNVVMQHPTIRVWVAQSREQARGMANGSYTQTDAWREATEDFKEGTPDDPAAYPQTPDPDDVPTPAWGSTKLPHETTDAWLERMDREGRKPSVDELAEQLRITREAQRASVEQGPPSARDTPDSEDGTPDPQWTRKPHYSSGPPARISHLEVMRATPLEGRVGDWAGLPADPRNPVLTEYQLLIQAHNAWMADTYGLTLQQVENVEAILDRSVDTPVDSEGRRPPCGKIGAIKFVRDMARSGLPGEGYYNTTDGKAPAEDKANVYPGVRTWTLGLKEAKERVEDFMAARDLARKGIAPINPAGDLPIGAVGSDAQRYPNTTALASVLRRP